jgi:hypothetical protein
LIEKIIFLRISPSFHLNSFLQIHLGAVSSHVPASLTERSYFGRAGVNAVSINHCISPQTQGLMQHPAKIKTLATTIKEVKTKVIQPFHLPNQFSIKSVKGSFIPEFSTSSLE